MPLIYSLVVLSCVLCSSIGAQESVVTSSCGDNDIHVLIGKAMGIHLLLGYIELVHLVFFQCNKLILTHVSRPEHNLKPEGYNFVFSL